MRHTFLIPLALTALLLLPQARADEEASEHAPKSDAATGLWEAHAKTFDLDGDGRIDWEEYQKATSGFTLLDEDKDGAITKKDLDALGEKLAKGNQGYHAAVFMGSPQGGLHQLFGGSPGHDTGALMRLLPLLFGGQGMHGGGENGLAERLEKMFPRGEHSDERAHVEGFGDLIPASLRQLMAFGLVAHSADEDGDRTITREEWTAGVKALTKEDGSLDLSGLKEGIGTSGMPFPGSGYALVETLLDLNGDGRVDAKDLEGVFDKADQNADGKVTHDELMPSGMGFFHDR